MNKEELLDKLRKMLFTTQQANECGLSNNDFKEDIETLSEAIGLIEKQEKEIHKLRKKNNDLLSKLRNRIKQVNKLTKYSNYKKEFSNLNRKIEKQEKIIDKMAEDIEEHMSEEVYNFLYICDKCKSNNEECHGDYCTETIKEYFKKDVEKC